MKEVRLFFSRLGLHNVFQLSHHVNLPKYVHSPEYTWHILLICRALMPKVEATAAALPSATHIISMTRGPLILIIPGTGTEGQVVQYDFIPAE